jgi:flagellar basal body-associated protein FliL
VAAVLVLGAGALAAILHRRDPTSSAAEPEVRGVMLDERVCLMVNLARDKRLRVLRTDIALEAKDETARRELVARRVEVKDLLGSLLSGKRFVDMESPEAKRELRREMAAAINEELALPGAVIRVYFDRFIIQ